MRLAGVHGVQERFEHAAAVRAFDRVGDFHSNALKVTERYTPRSADTLMYEATIEDPKTFSRPWKISMPLYRHVEKNAQLLEFKCVEFVEDLMYGQFSKKPKE